LSISVCYYAYCTNFTLVTAFYAPSSQPCREKSRLRAPFEKAFTFYNDIFADVFVAIIDDWKCPWVRWPTFKAIEKLNYTILFEGIVPGTPEMGHGQYVAVLRKTISY
jgi:hypothetical protein